ncbi:aminomethyl-transferring glycine dehydrogenase [Akkermansiaceae bacterium]|nr:aminomethyl-transferring glycine dehydrogenase [Akkermansiaceae bacterium]MDB4287029.1 aminomethyl-transferring glycine dehydrogenase [Akkermansiaceae bacterium]
MTTQLFSRRHIGPWDDSREALLEAIGRKDLDSLLAEVVPSEIQWPEGATLPEALSEPDALAHLKEKLGQNKVLKSFIGQGYHGTVTPPVIQRNILENPGWYTAYTPYQPEISQGRLEALLNFQTLITELTGLDVANASLLDEATAAAEAMSLALTMKPKATVFWVDEDCHPQTIDVVRTRAEPLGIEVKVEHVDDFAPSDDLIGAIVQYPSTLGDVRDFTAFSEKVHEAKAQVIIAADLLALTLLKSPGSMGADICVGSSQRFGVPLGFGGPHAAFISCADKLKRKIPGRLIGVSIDSQGNPAYRLSLQTREQHIRRDKATSNICTAQVLLAVMASMYAVYHGPDGLLDIAIEVSEKATRLAQGLEAKDYEICNESLFDTVTVDVGDLADQILNAAVEKGYNLRDFGDGRLGIAFDETTSEEDLQAICGVFGTVPGPGGGLGFPKGNLRQDGFLKQDVFHIYRSETDMMRYLHRLEARDLALNESMIPLGSCTMKLNAAAEMMPVSWPEVGQLHPFVPEDQSIGYREMLTELSEWLAEITGFAAVSLQPNAGSQGEYAGLLAIRSYHQKNGDTGRNKCLIPMSAHGTNPASAVMTGFQVVPIKCDDAGNIDTDDLHAKIAEHRETLGALMVTYPSTHGVYEEGIQEMCAAIHEAGGQVYMDGANMNAQVGVTNPGRIGADVCHLNLHKTFCIPHGGGGPGVGPIGVAPHLVEFLPGHRDFGNSANAVCSAPWGSASINVISWMYIAMMGSEGLKTATGVAILSANYIAKVLAPAYPILYTGRGGLVAHECIIDTRPLTKETGITVEDVAKRLIDYGFHAPTMSWPVAGTLMIEPTESESKDELDRFCEAMLAIHAEAHEVVAGTADPIDNVLKNAPHTAEMVISDEWSHPYSREKAAFPVPRLRKHKFWPVVGRVDNVHGDRNLVCTCDTVENYARPSE